MLELRNIKKYYKMGENVDAIKTSKGLASSNTGIIYFYGI